MVGLALGLNLDVLCADKTSFPNDLGQDRVIAQA
jgi:hypothetical protein